MSDTKYYKLPDAAVANIRRALAISKMIGHPTKDANLYDIAGPDDLPSLKHRYQRLIRLSDSGLIDLKKRAFDGTPHDSVIQYMHWGGSAALAHCRKVLKEEQIIKSYDKDIQECELTTEDVIPGYNLHVEKQHNEELMQVTYVAMMPDEVDLHGDFTSADEVRKAKESFNKSAMRANLFHRMMTDKFSVIESYLAPTDFILGEIPVKKGTWLMTFQVYDESIWKMIKSGDINGISIGAMAKVIPEKDDE
jgi:hypothetical protein